MLIVNLSDKALCNFLLLQLLFHLKMAEFLDGSFKTSPCMKTSLLCENQFFFFLLFWNVVTFIKGHSVVLCYFLQHDEVFLGSLWGSSYRICVFIDQLFYHSVLSMIIQSQNYLYDKVMNCFCGMVDQWKAFNLIFSWDHCQRSSPLQISDIPQTAFKPAQNLSSALVEWSCAVEQFSLKSFIKK